MAGIRLDYVCMYGAHTHTHTHTGTCSLLEAAAADMAL